MLQLSDIEAAAERLRGVAHQTPILTSRTLDDLCGARVYLKAECHQRAGAFKFRGAYNALSSLSQEDRRRGVVAASSGNHAQAVALAASLLGIDATLVMPSDAPASKCAATKGYGAHIVFFDRYRENREEIQDEIGRSEGRVVIPPYDNYTVMAGQGTTALETLEQVGDLDVFLAPVSGGGLVAGCATAVKAKLPAAKVFGVEPEAADDTRRSLEAGKRIGGGVPTTIADGLQAPTPGELTFPINQKLLDRVLVASETKIVEAMRFMLERQKTLVEPSGATALAGLLQEPRRFEGLRVGVVLSGGNVDLPRFCDLLKDH